MTLEVIPLSIKREIGTDDKLVDVILSSKPKFEDGDILVLSQKIVSKQEGRIVNISLVIPSILALGIGSEYEKDPKLIEIILSETKRIVRMGHGILIVETKNGLICANAGVDESNVNNGYATLLPSNPD
ncbi:MAG: coenzyme F420-0:L-glutamate ligase, partial [Thaumarchaeota archaeon]|nr:coenzyme F420-0:L-glutamate ligase [Nitrososphaerota archaeon]